MTSDQIPELLEVSEINALWELVRVWHKKEDKAEIYFGKACRKVPNERPMISHDPFLYDETDITMDVREDWDENTRKYYRISALKKYDTSSICIGSYTGYPGEDAEKYFLRTQKVINDRERVERERQTNAKRHNLENALSEARLLLQQGGRE